MALELRSPLPMNHVQRLTSVASVACLLAAVALVEVVGVIPALVVVWAGSFLAVLALLRYEGRRHRMLVAGPVPRADTIEPIDLTDPVVSLAEAGSEGARETSAHGRRRRPSHEPMPAAV